MPTRPAAPAPHASAVSRAFERASSRSTRATGSAQAFFVALGVIVVWLTTGPLFHFSDTWQLFINTGTTIVTFLMVFVIQQSQNKDTVAIQLKLNELIACTATASNHLIGVEDLSEHELRVLKDFYVKLARIAAESHDFYSTHSLDEADRLHAQKGDPRNNTATKP